ncbi:MAG: bifunctional DNA-formamidopyrimidine glycosylase/DNA-(apurinic or apyrimidinic site) lyase [Patescibacteria group bacterium]|nr:bifunctional DNA-formamidopyrimidine glycosylase/DNA-(apurinic or apyrimidinic site) lyase [Patescibacteria group bacterium]
MPELPEVQTTVNGLNRRVSGLTINDVWTDYNSPFHAGRDNIKDPVFFKYFKGEVAGAKIVRVDRRAKNILIHIEKAAKKSVILIHMKMTGHVMYGHYVFDKEKTKDPWTPAANERESLRDPFNRRIHLVMTLSNGKQIVLSDTRKFAKVTMISETHLEENLQNSEHLSDLGPEPLDKNFSFHIFKKRLDRRPNGRIKNVLMDQTVIAGVGNIYSDEALWRAGIHPEERVKNIPDALLKKLYAATLAVLKNGIDFGGDSMSDYRNIDGERGRFQEKHQAYRKTGEKCSKPGCHGTITRKVVGGRSAHFCDTHQKLLGK